MPRLPVRLAPLIMAGVAASAAVAGVGVLSPSRRRRRSAPDNQARRIAGVMLLSLAIILTIFALTLDTI